MSWSRQLGHTSSHIAGGWVQWRNTALILGRRYVVNVLLQMQRNEDFAFDRKYFRGPKENEVKFKEIHVEKNKTEWQK